MNLPLVAGFVLAILMEIVVPVAAGFWIQAHLNTPWCLFGYGALVFAIAQLAFRIPFVNWLGRELGMSSQRGSVTLLAWLVFLAASTAITEQVGRYFGYRILFKDLRRNWNNAVMYGLGHGGLESAFIVGLPSMITLVNILMIPSMDPAALGLNVGQTRQLLEAKRQIAAGQFWVPFLGGVERVFMLAFQIALSVLVLQVFSRRAWRWLGYALALHFLVDLTVALIGNHVNLVLGEAVLAAFAAGASYWALRLRPLPARTRL